MEQGYRYINSAILLIVSVSGLQAMAQEVSPEGGLKAGESQLNATFVATYQSVDERGVDDESLYSVDLTYQHQFDGFGVYGWLEYAKPTKANGVSNYTEFANADAGTITDPNGQLSEFYFYGNVDGDGEPGWRFGINEVTTLVDRSALANDEVEQFLSLPLVNNLTIAFPDYALSGFYQDLSAFGDFGYRLVASSSDGFADNGTGSYSELVDVGGAGKGIFSAFELVFDGDNHQSNVGYWRNNGDNRGGNYGLYAGVDYFFDSAKMNFRYGQADALQGNAEQFASVAWQKEISGGELAFGYTFTRYNQVANTVMRTAELYYRAVLSEQLFFSPALQWGNGANFNGDDLLLSLRVEFSI